METPQKNKDFGKSAGLFTAGAVCATLSFIWGISDNVPAILLMLFGFCLCVYSLVSRFGKTKELSAPQQLLYWSPRVLCMVFAAFTCIFAADVFEEVTGFWKILFALCMHLIPTFVLIAVLIVSWKREWIGGVLFNLLALLYIVSKWGEFPLGTYLIIAGPLMLTGILFILNWLSRKRPKAGQ